ncbi:polysaccharide biosynthesis tyrosine autokinase [Pedobacter nutrimenti]|uniref:GumC family protein n=1 Tax=Pedobacter nutrimenti TaxID=1241337 RepID=UPI002930BC63|nr:polysaccharide biosynthesis tyrosine autokinase [Pedobacter nutrimenti]
MALNQLFTRCIKYWYIFLISVIICIGVAYAYLQTTVPFYKVSSTLLIQDDAKGDGLLKGTAFSDLNMFRSSKTVENEMEVLRSKDLIYKVLYDLGLEVKYSYRLPFKKKELYGKTLPIQVVVLRLNEPAFLKKLSVQSIADDKFVLRDSSSKIVYRYNQVISRPEYSIKITKAEAFNTMNKPVDISFVNLRKSAEAYSLNALTVLPVVKDANTIVLSLLDAIPARGVDILTRLIDTYNQENVMNKNIMALNTIKFIDGKLGNLTKDLTGVEQDVENYKRNNRVTELNSDAQMNLQSSGEYGQQLASSDVQISLVQSIIGYLNGGDHKFDLVPTTLGLKDPTLMSLTDKYNNLQIERERLLKTVRVNNPLVVNISDQLTGLKGKILENLGVIKRGLDLERSSLRNKTAQFESRLHQTPVIERGLIERSREQSVKNTLYHYLLQKREETELSLSATIPTSQVIDKPAYNSTPAKPKVQLIYMISILCGLLLPVSFVYARTQLNNKVRDLSDVEYGTGHALILGELSHNGRKDPLLVHSDQSTTMAELFRYIRTSLNFIDKTNSNQVLLVTSSTKGEGKTFFTTNLGLTLTLSGKKVVLLEFDLRKPDLLNNLDLKATTGLSEYLSSSEIRLEDILMEVPSSPNLYTIGCGKIPSNPAELLMRPKVSELFAELRKRFDYIVVDTSPVGHVADAFSLSTFADASIYMVRYNFTQKADLGIFKDICEHKKLKNPLLVFNDARKENKNMYRYGRYAYTA